MSLTLRPYQTKAKDSIHQAFINGTNRIILCSPTGSGKTVTFAHMANEAVKTGSRVIIVVDRKELLIQAREKLMRYGINPSLIAEGRRIHLDKEVYIATVQTLIKRPFPEVDLIIIDEAHKQIFDKIFTKADYLDKYIIGATATPIRSGKMNQLKSIYSEIISTTTIRDLIKDGFLVPAITFGVKLDTSKIKVKGGDYDEKELFKVFNKPKLYAGVIEKYNHFAAGTKAVCFCINVEHSKATAQAFNDAGIPAMHVDGKTPTAQRTKIFESFHKGFFRVLCNVDIATTGWDDWTVETVIVNLSTKSLPKWLQMAGRGARPTDQEFIGKPGYLQKSHFNLIDMGGNVFRLGFWEHEREFKLTHRTKDKLEAAPVKECPEDKRDKNNSSGCGALIPASQMICKLCGYIFEVKKTGLAEGEFLPLEYQGSLPPELVGKAWGSMTLEELETSRISREYQLGWIVRQILLRKDLKLIDYAIMREFKNPEKWVQHQEQIYKAGPVVQPTQLSI